VIGLSRFKNSKINLRSTEKRDIRFYRCVKTIILGGPDLGPFLTSSPSPWPFLLCTPVALAFYTVKKDTATRSDHDRVEGIPSKHKLK